MRFHFVFLLAGLLLAASVHGAVRKPRSAALAAELFLVYLLVGYCGIPMLLVSGWVLLSPEQALAAFGFPSEGPLPAFFGYAYLGMSLLAVLAFRYRGTYLIGPTVCWAVYLGGATVVHLGEQGGHSHGGALAIFAAHGLIAILLIAGLVGSGVLKRSPAGSSGPMPRPE